MYWGSVLYLRRNIMAIEHKIPKNRNFELLKLFGKNIFDRLNNKLMP